MVRKITTPLLSCLCVSALAVTLHAQVQSTPAEEHGYHIISPTLCFTLTIPGDWEPARDEGLYRSRDGKQFVGVLRFSAKNLQREAGISLVEKEAAAVQGAYEKDLRKKLLGVTLAPFESAIPGTWKWSATLPEVKDRDKFHLPKRYFVDFSPEGLVVFNIQGTPDDDAFARRIIATVRHSKERPCQLPKSTKELMKILRENPAALGGGPAVIQEQKPVAAPREYRNPAFPWSVKYPGDWKLDMTDPGQMQFLHPSQGDQAGCSIFSIAVQYGTVDEFADFWMTQVDKHTEDLGTKVNRGPKRKVYLTNDVVAIEVMREFSPAGGRSRAIYALADGVGYVIECETSMHNWDSLAATFDQFINSFALEKKP